MSFHDDSLDIHPSESDLTTIKSIENIDESTAASIIEPNKEETSSSGSTGQNDVFEIRDFSTLSTWEKYVMSIY